MVNAFPMNCSVAKKVYLMFSQVFTSKHYENKEKKNDLRRKDVSSRMESAVKNEIFVGVERLLIVRRKNRVSSRGVVKNAYTKNCGVVEKVNIIKNYKKAKKNAIRIICVPLIMVNAFPKNFGVTEKVNLALLQFMRSSQVNIIIIIN
jgi:hypothetical protein